MNTVCGLCLKPSPYIYEVKAGVFACYKCEPLVPEVSLAVDALNGHHSNRWAIMFGNYPELTGNGNHNTGMVHEISEEDGTYTCDLCAKTFRKSIQYHNHMRNHKADKRFICTYCTKAFSQSNNLRAHLRTHTNERPYKCSECGKAFTQVTNLNNHMRLHTGERPYVCAEPGCNKAFAQVTNLNQHRKRHMSGEYTDMLYDCTVCGRHFQQRNHLYLHKLQSHTELRGSIHACNICHECFMSEDQLIDHIKSHDRDDVKPEFSKCIFKSCESRFNNALDHRDHLIEVHKLNIKGMNVTSSSAIRPRGRPPKDREPAKIDPFFFSKLKMQV